jgi:hypothetical protein
MKTKKQTINCDLCKKEIFTKEEKYVHIEDWNKETLIKDMWCHITCFNKAMNRDLTELEKQAKAYLEQAGKIMNKIQNNGEEVYTL